MVKCVEVQAPYHHSVCKTSTSVEVSAPGGFPCSEWGCLTGAAPQLNKFKTKKDLITALRAEDKQPQTTCLVFVPEIGKIAPKRESTLLS